MQVLVYTCQEKTVQEGSKILVQVKSCKFLEGVWGTAISRHYYYAHRIYWHVPGFHHLKLQSSNV